MEVMADDEIVQALEAISSFCGTRSYPCLLTISFQFISPHLDVGNCRQWSCERKYTIYPKYRRVHAACCCWRYSMFHSGKLVGLQNFSRFRKSSSEQSFFSC